MLSLKKSFTFVMYVLQRLHSSLWEPLVFLFQGWFVCQVGTFNKEAV